MGLLRDTLYAAHQLLIRGAHTDLQQEELAGFEKEKAQLDSTVARVFEAPVPPRGAARDDAVRALARAAQLSPATLYAGRNKTGRVLRSGVVV